MYGTFKCPLLNKVPKAKPGPDYYTLIVFASISMCSLSFYFRVSVFPVFYPMFFDHFSWCICFAIALHSSQSETCTVPDVHYHVYAFIASLLCICTSLLRSHLLVFYYALFLFVSVVYHQAVLFYCCPDCPSCQAYLNSIGWVTWAIWKDERPQFHCCTFTMSM